MVFSPQRQEAAIACEYFGSDETSTVPASLATPILRNFSYPTSISTNVTQQTGVFRIGDITQFTSTMADIHSTSVSKGDNGETSISFVEDEMFLFQVYGDDGSCSIKQPQYDLIGQPPRAAPNRSTYYNNGFSISVPRSPNTDSTVGPWEGESVIWGNEAAAGKRSVQASVLEQSSTSSAPLDKTQFYGADNHLEKTVTVSSIRSGGTPFSLRRIGSTGSGDICQCDTAATSGPQWLDGYRASRKRKGWLSQLKTWMTLSEPSTRALKKHKQNIYKKAGISADDPQASTKLHLPFGTLPADAIKPAGSGPDPEEIAMKKAEQERELREQMFARGARRSSRSTTSRYSSLSSAPSRDMWDRDWRKGSTQSCPWD